MPFQTPLPDTVTIDAKRVGAVLANGSVVYEGDVVVRYGATKLTADRVVAYRGTVVLNEDGKTVQVQQIVRGVAEGAVVLVDPAGTVNADRVEFGLDPAHRYETADNLSIRIGNGILRARHADLQPDVWQLYDVEGTTCFEPRPIYYVTSDRVTITPNKQAVIHQPRLSAFGHFLGELPTQRASLIQAVPGIGYPALNRKKSGRLGIVASGGLLVGRQDIFSYNQRAFYQQRFNGLVQYTHSFLPVEKATQIVAPQSDFNERFNHGFLSNSRVDSPDEEASFYRARRSSLSFDGQLRGGASGRVDGGPYNKLEAVYEGGGQVGGAGYLGQVRLQGIQPDEDMMRPRLKFVGALDLAQVRVGPSVQLLSRIDSESFFGKTGYGWLQATSGIVYRPSGWLRLAAGGYLAGDAGTPQYGMDPLYAERGLLARSDVRFGGFTFTYLVKRDADRGAFDHEFAFRQVIGCLEAFYSKREFPHDRHVGITLRVQPFVDAIKRRVAQATGDPPPTPKGRW